MSPQDVAAVAAIARDLTVGGVLLLIIGAWLRGIVTRTADYERAITDLKANHTEAIRQLKEGYEALLAQVRAELAASERREEEWKETALEQRRTMREAVNVASNTGRG